MSEREPKPKLKADYAFLSGETVPGGSEVDVFHEDSDTVDVEFPSKDGKTLKVYNLPKDKLEG